MSESRTTDRSPSTPTDRRKDARATTLEGEVLRVTYENEATGFRVLKVTVEGQSQPETVIGTFPTAPIGSKIRATGRYGQDPKHGPQFKAETVLVVAPDTLVGLERYLGSGSIPGIGPAYAKRIIEAFGEATLEVLDHQTDRLTEVAGLGPRRASAVAAAWRGHRTISAIMIFLQTHGASPALAARIYKQFGHNAMDVVARTPYRLALEVWGVGFLTADKIAQSVGIGEDAPERAQAGLLHVLNDVTGRGNVFGYEEELITQTAELLGRDAVEIRGASDALEASGHIRRERLDTDRALYPTTLHSAEVRAAKRMREIASAPFSPMPGARVESLLSDFEKRFSLTLAPAQRDAMRLATQHAALIVTGGPGVGKTTVVRALLHLLAKAGRKPRLAAPTGRAAKRMTEATGLEAITLHRLLEFDPKRRAFSRTKANPIEGDLLIVDESSMIDLPLFDALTQAVGERTQLILIGDADQLPSVGPGAVLRDLIASGVVPTARLTQVFRQAEQSLIVKNAHMIQEGLFPEGARDGNGEFFIVERKDADQAAETIRELVTKRIPQRFGLDPVRDVQVLTPMNRGSLGVHALNQMLQETLNPSGEMLSKGARTFRSGDKVMQLRNNYDKDVFNGDIGFVEALSLEDQTLQVRFDERLVDYEMLDLDELGLAYATSIHKSQGSEYPAVVIPMLTQHFVMLSRNLLYTAVTRGKKLVILVADPRAIALSLAETRKEDRRTRLSERLKAD